MDLPFSLIWNAVLMSGLVLQAANFVSGQLQKCSVGLTFAASLEPSKSKLACLNLFYRYSFVSCASFRFVILTGGPLVIVRDCA